MSPQTAAEVGFFRRLEADAALIGLLGSAGRIIPGWPTDSREASDFPRLTFYVFGPPPRRPGFQRVRITADLWVWPVGMRGGRPKLLSVDDRLLELLDEQHFTHDSYRLYSLAGGFRDYPAGPNQPLRRTREFTIEASPR